MNNDEFLLITPEGWIEIEDAVSFVSQIGESLVYEMISAGEFENLSQHMESQGLILENQVIQNARMINTPDGYRFWYVI